MTTSERNRLNFRAKDGKPVSLYLDPETVELLDRIQLAEGRRNRSATVRLLAAQWAESQDAGD